MFEPIDTCLWVICKSVTTHSLVLPLRILLEHLIRFSCVVKQRISIGKKYKLRHSRDRCQKDIKRKKKAKRPSVHTSSKNNFGR